MFKTPIRQTCNDLFFTNELLTDIKFDHLVELGTRIFSFIKKHKGEKHG